MIDPGHGGEDTGAIGPGGTKEADLTWFVASCLATLLEGRGHDVVITRRGDLLVPVHERSRIANEVNADLFVSIHFNGYDDPRANGTETLYLPGDPKSQRLARRIQGNLVQALRLKDRGIKPRYDLHVLRETTMPAVVVEVAFVTNPGEEKLFLRPYWIRRSAQAIAWGIEEFRKER